VDVTVLAVPDCPGAVLLEERLAAVASGMPGVRVTRRVITGEAAAVAAGMHGSPTLLVNGADPFARPGQQPALACRLYEQDDGSLAPAPTAGQLHRALSQASRP
jgi:hypothetical protein